MPATPPPPSGPEPDDGRPLSEREQRDLIELGEHLQASDPHLGEKLTTGPEAGLWPTWATRGRVVTAVVVGLGVLVLLPAEWRSVIVLFAVMFGLPLALVAAGRGR